METSDSHKGIKEMAETLGKSGPGKAFTQLLLAVLVVGGITAGLFQTNEAGQVSVKQSLLTGKVSIISEPGIFCQCLGKVTTYKEAGTFKFAKLDRGPEDKAAGKPRKGKDLGPEVSDEIEIRFNDGGRGWISGMALFDLPKESDKLGLIHKKFRSFDKLLESGIIPTIRESVILTASLMSSGESYTTKRAMLTEWARDQIGKGTYVTEAATKTVQVKMSGGNKVRNENPLERYGITLKQFQITDIRYETETENIIKTKREALQQTIAAKISAERAIQERIAAEEMGKKDVKVAEYKALVNKKKAEVEAEEVKAVAIIIAQKKTEVAKIEKAQALRGAAKKVELEKLNKERAIIEAEKNLQVAKLKVQSAAKLKTAEVLEGQGLAEKKRLVYKADGALQEKLDAYVKVMSVLAKELGKQKWVPDVVMGGGQKGQGDGNMAMNFMNMWMMKTAKDIGVEMVASKKGRKKVR